MNDSFKAPTMHSILLDLVCWPIAQPLHHILGKGNNKRSHNIRWLWFNPNI